MTSPGDVYRLFFEPGEIVEIRAIGVSGNSKVWDGFAGGGVVFGYFDNAKDFEAAANGLDKQNATGIYFTPNPCDPSLIARATNRLVVAGKKSSATSDANIKAIRYLLIDLDPERPAGISSTDEELEAARMVGGKVTEWLEGELGFPSGIRGLSGNGYHIIYRLSDLPNTDEISGAKGLISQCLAAIEKKCGTKKVKIDQKVFNAARIWKLYGTTARKGDSTRDRPHRISSIFKAPQSLADVPVTARELLEKLASFAPKEKKRPANLPSKKKGKTSRRKTDLGALKVDEYLAHYGVALKGVKTRGAATWYLLEKCLFDESHSSGEAAIVFSPEPPFLTYHCFHDSCRHRTWKDAKQIISGNDKLAQFCEGYDPNWRPKKEPGCELLENAEIVPGNAIKGAAVVPKPEDMSPLDFCRMSDKGKPRFVVMLMARYLAMFLDPIVHTNGVFWRYEEGVWKVFSRHKIRSVVAAAIKDMCQASHLGNSEDILAAIINREEEDWKVNTDLVNLKNGMLDIENGELLPHKASYGSRVQLPVEFNPDALCPRWYKFLEEIFPEKDGVGRAKRWLLQEFSGYCLMPHCRYEKALFLYGTGANGKSTVLNILESLVGTENISSLGLDELGRSFSIPYLQGKMINLATEIETRERAGTETLKKAISGDILEGERKYGEKVMFRSTAKFIFAMNSPPTITDKAHGFSRKVVILNFNRRLSEDEMDRELTDKLRDEISGILTWAWIGAVRLIKQSGFSIEDAIREDTETFLASMNPFLSFLDEKCFRGYDNIVPCTDLFKAYKEWCQESLHRPLSKSKFYEQVLTQWPETKKQKINFGTSRRWGFSGIGLDI